MDVITDYFLQQGVLGVIIVMLIAVIIWQQRRIDGKDKQIEILQEKRKADTDTYTESYTAVAKEQIGIQRDTVNSLNLLQRSTDSVANTLRDLVNGKK